jgi:hypothetical protein
MIIKMRIRTLMSKYSPEVSEASKVATGADYINALAADFRVMVGRVEASKGSVLP